MYIQHELVQPVQGFVHFGYITRYLGAVLKQMVAAVEFHASADILELPDSFRGKIGSKALITIWKDTVGRCGRSSVNVVYRCGGP